MDAFRGRSQTTKGIWLARCAGIEPCTLVMDLEGTDGREHGEDDTAFEKQSALFALAVSDIVLINMCCHNIGWEQASNMPLLKTVFQTPLENLEPVLREDIQKIWDSVPMPEAHRETPLSEFFNVEAVALSSFEEKEEQFREQVANLRQRFYHSIAPGGLAGDQRDVVPASGFSFSAQQIWKVIKENRDLDLPAHKVMVATIFKAKAAGRKIAAASPTSISVDTLNGGEAFSVAAHGCTETYITLFDEGSADAIIELANWDSSKARDKLHHDIDAHVASVLAAKFSELHHMRYHVAKLNDALSAPVEALLDGPNNETWPAIRKLLQHETESAVSGLSSALSGFDMDEKTKEKTLTSLKDYARGVVEAKGKEEAGRVLSRMKDRFSMLFSHDSDSMPQIRTGNEDIRAITKTARTASLKLLSIMAAICLDDTADNIEYILSLALVDTKNNASDKSITTADPLAASTSEQVAPSKTLITPVECKSLCRQFKAETEYSVTQAISAQEANKRNNNWLPPPWATLALIILGFNEFITLLRNPFYLLLIFMSYLLIRAQWVQLDIAGDFQNGALPGLLSLSTKFLPTVTNLPKKLALGGQILQLIPLRESQQQRALDMEAEVI
ncbi:hypothetical protein SLEP1_g13481 [Rubroshorea leprosula]|uniref:GB1/RHD3-type G domain-containing protein n=1 Tax=Rubroshorea leprosula TaxID=152421 RepID=A0AAV5ILX5_9ROSI|nr:hypothetical protein SLEP1_g13481 [Rubroshorea leprosula]